MGIIRRTDQWDVLISSVFYNTLIVADRLFSSTIIIRFINLIYFQVIANKSSIKSV